MFATTDLTVSLSRKGACLLYHQHNIAALSMTACNFWKKNQSSFNRNPTIFALPTEILWVFKFCLDLYDTLILKVCMSWFWFTCTTFTLRVQPSYNLSVWVNVWKVSTFLKVQTFLLPSSCFFFCGSRHWFIQYDMIWELHTGSILFTSWFW